VLYVDADACPVKEEIYRVASRYALPVTLVANSAMRVPQSDLVRLVVVGGGIDVADDWIAERAGRGDIVITADIPLAARCIEKGARVIGTTGNFSPKTTSATHSQRASSSPISARSANRHRGRHR
jgi:uncharacterized protein YaiI (UPF0178 family)